MVAHTTTTIGELRKKTSAQNDEFAIMARCLAIAGIEMGWCVDFGASDGVTNSNTMELVLLGWRRVCVEADVYHAELAETNAKAFGDVVVNEYVGWSDDDSADALLRRVDGLPKRFGVMSLDIDGNEYHVWEAMKEYRPALVVVEFNPTITPGLAYVQPKDRDTMIGSSLDALYALARSKGYRLVAVTCFNAIFVEEEHFASFDIEDDSPFALRVRESIAYVPILIYGYDGLSYVCGNKVNPWLGEDGSGITPPNTVKHDP